MTKKVYRTAQGKIVDLGSIILQNENTRAVGNMGVNARGDIVDSRGRSVKSRSQQVSKQYQRQTTNVHDEPVKTSRRVTPDEAVPEKQAKQHPAEPTPEISSEPVVTMPEAVDASSGGLAAAIAKARAIKQEPLKTPRQLKQDRAGVTKI